MEPDVLDQLRDLHIQATEERSHHYTGHVIRRAIEEIECLRRVLAAAHIKDAPPMSGQSPSSLAREKNG